MSRSKPSASDELRAEYDFNQLSGGVRAKYLRRYRAGTNLALLDPDVAAAFPTDEAVNQALRAVLTAAAAIKRGRRASNKALQQTTGAGKVSEEPRPRRGAGRR